MIRYPDVPRPVYGYSFGFAELSSILCDDTAVTERGVKRPVFFKNRNCIVPIHHPYVPRPVYGYCMGLIKLSHFLCDYPIFTYSGVSFDHDRFGYRRRGLFPFEAGDLVAHFGKPGAKVFVLHSGRRFFRNDPVLFHLPGPKLVYGFCGTQESITKRKVTVRISPGVQYILDYKSPVNIRERHGHLFERFFKIPLHRGLFQDRLKAAPEVVFVVLPTLRREYLK